MTDLSALFRHEMDAAALLRFFEFEHLPPHLQDTSRPFHALANDAAGRLPASGELTAGLRKLLEAKDCFVRAAVEAQRAAGSTS